MSEFIEGEYGYILDLVKYHMHPFKEVGPEPWASQAKEDLARLAETRGDEFMRELYALNECDKLSSCTETPSAEVISEAEEVIKSYFARE